MQCPSAQRMISMEDRLALLLSAIFHDLDHDGHSNNFHIQTQSNLARLYNDRCVWSVEQVVWSVEHVCVECGAVCVECGAVCVNSFVC